jgi:hypothetical protein
MSTEAMSYHPALARNSLLKKGYKNELPTNLTVVVIGTM